MSGHPAASVRAGLTDSGLPCGLQIVAERYREDLVLQASYAYEQARPWNNKWPEILGAADLRFARGSRAYIRTLTFDPLPCRERGSGKGECDA